ncbi:MAG: zinc ribbon domain-containing protein YjdM [Bdellovibrionales bacterium]
MIKISQKQDNCPNCTSSNIYHDGSLWICPECGHEWLPMDEKQETTLNIQSDQRPRDINGQILSDGDSVLLMKDLKINGGSGTLKSGTKVKNIKISDQVDDHNIVGKIDGQGSIYLKSEFVKKI